MTTSNTHSSKRFVREKAYFSGRAITSKRFVREKAYFSGRAFSSKRFVHEKGCFSGQNRRPNLSGNVDINSFGGLQAAIKQKRVRHDIT